MERKIIKKQKMSDSSVGSYQSDRKYKKPLITQICKKSLSYEGIARNPVVVIHGFLGAQLKNINTDNMAWGSFMGVDLIKGYSETELQELSLPMGVGKPLNELKDDVKPVGLLQTFDVNLFGVHFHKDAYIKMIKIIEDSGYINEEKPIPEGKNFHTLFTFYYDWRRDLPENAALLYKFILEKRKYLQNRFKELYGIENYDVHFDIVAHSMGGLISRYFLKYGDDDLSNDDYVPEPNWKGSRFVDKLVIIGTPNAGYLDTCTELIEGLQIAKHLPFYPPAVIGTFHSYYQMMPLASTKSITYQDDSSVVDIFDHKTWIDMKWGLADPAQDKYLQILLPEVSSWQERRLIALDHLKKCLKRARQFTEAMCANVDPPGNVTYILFCGNAVETSLSAKVDPATGEFIIDQYGAGDGKVLSISARMDERVGREWSLYAKSPIKWDTVIHLRAAHMGITDSYGFAHNLIYYLLGMEPKNYSEREAIVNELSKRQKSQALPS